MPELLNDKVTYKFNYTHLVKQIRNQLVSKFWLKDESKHIIYHNTLAEYRITSSLFSFKAWLLPYDARLSAARGSAWHNSNKPANWYKQKWNQAAGLTYLWSSCDNKQILWGISINIFHFDLYNFGSVQQKL